MNRLAILALTLSFVLFPLRAKSQSGFNIEVTSDTLVQGRWMLIVYDSTPRTVQSYKTKAHKTFFKGSVKNPVYAELRHSSTSRPLPFFIENSDIKVLFDFSNPYNSKISGSITNSQMRYILEICNNNSPSCIAQNIEENPTVPFASYLILNYIAPTSDIQYLQNIVASLSGEATTAYHYKELQVMLNRALTLQPGNKLPSLYFLDADGKSHSVDSLLDNSRRNLLFFAATWCSQCDTIQKRIDTKEINTIRIDIDHDPNGWDSPIMKKLQIDHLPYLILIDRDRRIVARDIRYWQLN